jgi:hypothetical protein
MTVAVNIPLPAGDPVVMWTISPLTFVLWVGGVALIAFGLGWISGFGWTWRHNALR